MRRRKREKTQNYYEQINDLCFGLNQLLDLSAWFQLVLLLILFTNILYLTIIFLYLYGLYMQCTIVYKKMC